MYKNKYFIFPVIVFILLICTAAMCNLCSLPLIPGAGQQNENDNKNSDGNNSVQNAHNNNVNTDNREINKKTAPDLVLKVYEGPVYLQAEDLIYYRIKAEVTGNPLPEVSFSKDDSKGAWGPLNVQVNLKKGETYRLAATASNTEGKKTNEILLGWDGVLENVEQAVQQDNNIHNDEDIDDIQQQDGDAGQNILDGGDQNGQDMEFAGREFIIWNPSRLTEESGWFISGQGGKYYYGQDLYTGDTGLSEIGSNRQCSGFIVFDISEMQNVFAYDAYLEFNIKEKFGDPTFYNNFKISVFLGNLMIEVFTVASDNSGSFLLSSRFFTETVNKIIATGQDKLEVYCDFMPYASNQNNVWDGWTYEQTGIIFTVVEKN